MDFIVNFAASVSGIWKKVSSFLPLLIGLGSLLAGLAGICNEFGHAANAAAILALFQNLQNDPNTALVIAGLAGLGIHTTHQDMKANIASNTASNQPVVQAPAQTEEPKP